MIVEPRDFLFDPIFQTFLQAFENNIDSIVITSTSPEEHFLYVNEAFKRKTLYKESELIGKSPRILQGSQTDRATLNELKRKLQTNEDFIGQTTNYRKDGTPYIVKWYVSALKNKAGEIIAYLSCQKELTQILWEHQQYRFLSQIAIQMNQSILVTDLLGNIAYVNPAFEQQSGYTEKEVLGKNVRILKSGKLPKSFYKNLWETLLQEKSFRGLFINKTKDDRFYYEQKTITPIKNDDANVEFYASFGQDVTHLVEEKNMFEQKAYKDQLTGLHNRIKYGQIIKEKYDCFLLYKKVFSIILIDIDNFKSINDTYGHSEGDKVLKKFASILKSNLRKNDTVFRWGGEEFVLLLDESKEIAFQIAKQLCNEIAKSLHVKQKSVTASFGVSSVVEHENYEELFERVDQALYQSKSHGKNRVTML
jgi:diguanylate cyclase (GGDEF)-like protein/PAS domain S-box-containing protein